MRVLLDTHALIWSISDPAKLSERARRVVESFDNEILVSAASAWEITTKVRIGKLPEAAALAQDFGGRIEQIGFQGLPISVLHAQRAGSLPGTHKDPFDRILIAQALAEGIAIVSNEALFDQYMVERIW